MNKTLIKYEELFGRKLKHIGDNMYLEYTDEGIKEVSYDIIEIRLMENEKYV